MASVIEKAVDFQLQKPSATLPWRGRTSSGNDEFRDFRWRARALFFMRFTHDKARSDGCEGKSPLLILHRMKFPCYVPERYCRDDHARVKWIQDIFEPFLLLHSTYEPHYP